MSDVVAFAALGTSLFGLGVMSRQLHAARQTTARGLIIGARPATGIVDIVNGVEQPSDFEFSIRSRGPGTFFDIAGNVLKADGIRHAVIESIPRMNNTSGTASGTLAMTTEEARSAWFVVTWVAAHRGGIRTEGYRLRVQPPLEAAPSRTTALHQDESDEELGVRTSERPIEVFRWDCTWRARNQAWMCVRRWIPAWVRRAAPNLLAERFQRSGRWRRLPPSVPVRGMWPSPQDQGRWY